MSTISPEPIMQILGGQLTARYLGVANEIGLFEAMNGGAYSLDYLAEQTGVPQRTLRIVADALVAAGLIARDNGRYKNTPVTETFLSGQSPMDMRPILRLFDKVVYEQWRTLETAVREDKRTHGLPEFDEAQHRIFNMGVATLTAPSAKALAQTYDFSPHRCILDVAGGMGLFLTMALQQNDHLRGTLFELPTVLQMVQKQLADSPMQARINLQEGDVLTDAIPTGHDLVILANVAHILSPTNNRAVLKRIRAAVEPGSRLLLIDFWTDPTHTEPKFAALLAAEFHIYSGEGDVYSFEEAEEWLARTGWQTVSKQHLAGAASLIVAEAI